MGHEFVPLATREDANDFLKEHIMGKKMLTFEQIGAAMPYALDDGKF